MSAPTEQLTDEQTVAGLAADNVELRRQVAELTPEHEMTAALSVLDAVKEVAMLDEVTTRTVRATDALITLLFLTFNLPAPDPVVREGGLVDAIFGKPVRPSGGES